MANYRMFSRNIDQAVEMLEKVFRNFENADSGDQDRFVPILISLPGVGKSSTIAKMAKRMGYNLIDISLSSIEPTDIIGLGAREKVDGRWMTMPALPKWVQTALDGNCIIFVDEFNNTTQDVLSGFQKMFSDFVVDGIELPRTTHIIGACNPPGDDALYAAKKLSGAFRRRLCMIPVIDDFEYVKKKHGFDLPRNYAQFDYTDLAEYCSYDKISSAVIDNIFNISKYEGLEDLEKVVLMNGFGQRALTFASDLELISSDLMASGRKSYNSEITEGEWKRDPYDVVEEYQQIEWGSKKISNSVSYSRSKKFVSRVENANVYSALLSLLKEEFSADYLSDSTPLPEER